jgi:hypothetical protein
LFSGSHRGITLINKISHIEKQHNATDQFLALHFASCGGKLLPYKWSSSLYDW